MSTATETTRHDASEARSPDGSSATPAVITLQHVEAFRTIYALSDIVKSRLDENGKPVRKATHYACVLVGGSAPLWGLFSARTNKLVSLWGGRKFIEDQYPNKVWVRRAATWSVNTILPELPTMDEKRSALYQQARGE